MTINVKFRRKLDADISATVATDIHSIEPWILTVHLTGDVKIHKLDSGDIIDSYYVAAWSAKYIARKNWYAVGGADGKLHIFDCTTHEELVSFTAHDSAITCLAVHPTAPIVLTSSLDKTMKAWDWENQWHNIHTYEGHTKWTRSITFNSKDPNTFASCCDSGIVKMWSIASPTPSFTIKAHKKHINCIDFYPGADKPYFITASDSKSIKIWDYLTQSRVHTITGHTSNVTFAVFHPSLPIIISGSHDGSIRIWNNRSYEIVRILSYEFGWARSISFRKDTTEVAVGFSKAFLSLSLDDSGPSQVVASSDTSDETSKEQIPNFLEGDIKEAAMGISTDSELELELAQSLKSFTTAFDTTLSFSPQSTTSPSQSHRLLRPEVNPRQECITIAMELIVKKAAHKLISELIDEEAQAMVEFLSKIINEENSLTQRDRKHALYLLSKLAKSAQVFPRSLELEGVQFDLSNPFTWGGYGVIFKGLHQGSQVCIKAVQVDAPGKKKAKLRAHAGELSIWAHLLHQNVLPFLGISPSAEEVPRVCIVSPWMNNGDLLQYLKNVPDVPRKPLVRDVISGLEYLHDLDIIHADLKAKNVLISESGRAMLADFGISRLSITRTTVLTNTGTGTAYWMAPELLLEQKTPSRESDIWAFACTCYEIITGMMPFSQYYMAPLLIGAFMMKKFIPSRPEEPEAGWDEDVWSVAMRCWKPDPSSRPNVHELLDMINSFDFMDDRPEDSQAESYKRRNNVRVDYNRIFSILDKIHQLVVI